MRVPLSWLKDFVDISIPAAELAQRLTRFGLEVEAIEYIGLDGAELPWEADKILIADILEVTQHPNADRLVLAAVDYGAAEPHTVVTGAPNLFAYKGQGRLAQPLKAVFAKEGAELYDGHAEGKVKVKLKGRPVRGIMSNAMLCSEKELGLSEEHEGILLLPADAPVGQPLRDYLGDAVFEVSVLPNMARALSIYGVAREVAALLGVPLKAPQTELQATGAPIVGRAQVTVEAADLCPRFTLALVEGVTIGPSPYWMQRRLTLAGMRPISNIVDITNYVMLELGQPSHAFDADRVAGQHLVVRLARAGEQLTTLDGKQHTFSRQPAAGSAGLTPLLVCDPDGPLALAGVMGGATSEVSDSTTRVLLEAAIWNPVLTRRTAQAYRLPSEASRRFERGVDWELPPLMQARALGLMQQITGGTVAAGLIDIYPAPWQPLMIALPEHEVARILGIRLGAAQIADLLRPLGFGCEVQAEQGMVQVVVPSYRQDVTLPADLCEEVARMYGYDNIPNTILADSLPEQRANPLLELEGKTRAVLSGAGLDEAITYALTNMASVARVDPAAADPAAYLKLANPLTPEREYLRRSLLPTLLEALADNLRERERVLLYEIGAVYLPRAGELLPDEPRWLAIALAGVREHLSWLTPRAEMIDFFDLKGVIETLLERLRLSSLVRFVPLPDDPRLHPGRAAALVVGGQGAGGRGQAPGRQGDQDASRPGGRETGRLEASAGEDRASTANPQSLMPDPRSLAPVGVLGELRPAVRERLGIEVPRVVVAELNLAALLGLVQPLRYTPISRYPAISQDLALLVGQDTPADQVAAAIRKYAGAELESLVLFDVYEDQRLGAGKRSLAYRLTFRSRERTLSDADLIKVRQKIIKGVERDVGATVRG